MATNDRGSNRSHGRSGRNNNPEGRNQYSGVASKVRDNPFATAAVVGGAAAAGIFLWSRRNQISEQIGELADQISEWRNRMGSDDDFAADDSLSGGPSTSRSRNDNRSQAEIAEEALTLKEIGKPA